MERAVQRYTGDVEDGPEAAKERLERAQARLESMDPKWVLQRGYAWLADAQGHAITSVEQARVGQRLSATLADGELNLTVDQRPLI